MTSRRRQVRSLRAAPTGPTRHQGTSCMAPPPRTSKGMSPRGDVCLASRWFGCDSRLVHSSDGSSSLRTSLVFCAWLNLVEHSVRAGEIGGSNPPAQTTACAAERCTHHADVAQLVEAAVSETVCCEGSNPSVGTNVSGSDLLSEASPRSSPDATRHRGGTGIHASLRCWAPSGV